jgi:hypothetical protein
LTGDVVETKSDWEIEKIEDVEVLRIGGGRNGSVAGQILSQSPLYESFVKVVDDQ